MKRAIRIASVVLPVLVLVAGCGGSKKSDSGSSSTAVQETSSATATAGGGDPQQQDAAVEATVRDFVSQVETCFVDQMDYSKCKRPQGTNLDIGSGAGQVEMTAAGTSTYTLVGHSESGNTFKVEKDSAGALKRSCEQADTGGCKQDGTW